MDGVPARIVGFGAEDEATANVNEQFLVGEYRREIEMAISKFELFRTEPRAKYPFSAKISKYS